MGQAHGPVPPAATINKADAAGRLAHPCSRQPAPHQGAPNNTHAATGTYVTKCVIRLSGWVANAVLQDHTGSRRLLLLPISWRRRKSTQPLPPPPPI